MARLDGESAPERAADEAGAPDAERGAPRRILIVASYAPSLVNFRGPLIAALTAKGHEVVAAAPSIDRQTEAALGALGARPVSTSLSNASLNPIGMYRSYRELRALLREVRPDVILSYTIKPVILGALAARAEGVPKIISLISGLGLAFTDERGLQRKLVRAAASLLYRAALARSDLALFQNRDDPEFLRRQSVLPPDVPVAVVDGSGVDIDHFAMAPPLEGASFLMIARLLRDKGVGEFAAAAKRLRQEHPEVPVALAGYLDPSPASLTQQELDELIGAGVRFHGRLDDVRPKMAECSVFVLPSYYREGTPRSVLEAMAMGRAIITTDAPGCRETVIDGLNGFLVPARDADSLYRAMKRFVDQPELAARMGEESRKLAERRYDARKVSADIMRHAGL